MYVCIEGNQRAANIDLFITSWGLVRSDLRMLSKVIDGLGDCVEGVRVS